MERGMIKFKEEWDNMKKGILITSFGTTYEETRKLCIESIENRIKDEFKDYLVLRAFTSRVVISRLKKNHNYFVDNPTEALEKMKDSGIKDIYVQPLLIIEGVEYDKIKKEVSDFLEKNKEFNIKVGKPLLTSDLDYDKAVEALKLEEDRDGQGIAFMGHGSYHSADIAYEKLQKTIKDRGYNNVFIGTVEGEKTLEDIIVELLNKKISNVLIKPFMLVAGDHARNDMASDDEDSWKSTLEKNNIKAQAIIKGLGEVKEIQDIFIEHLKDIMD